MKISSVPRSTASNLRLGIVFLVLLFAVLWIIHVIIGGVPTQSRTITQAYGLEITEDIIPEDSPLRTGRQRTIRYIVIHETGNHLAGADAHSHNRYLHSGGDGSTAWHYTVDDKSAYHHIPDGEIAYHAGDRNKINGGNRCGIGIELCVNSDSDFEKVFTNGAKLTAKLIETYDLSIKSIRQHSDFMDKNCPETIRDKERWGEFIDLVKSYLKEN